MTDTEWEKTPEQVQGDLEAGDVQLVDVREPYEWEAGRIDGARHLELEHLASQAASIDKERPVVFQCRSGVRSLMAARAFRTAGYDAWSLEGGITRWHAEGRPIVPADGHVADH